ncbi:hypothetical protein [Virgibacillus ainsalahensis]
MEENKTMIKLRRLLHLLRQKQQVFSMGRVIAVPDLLMGPVIAAPELFDGKRNRSPNLLENSLLIEIAVFIIDSDGILLAAMLGA